jgi:hypothetical protein
MTGRVLLVLPESHAFPRQKEALALARELKGKNPEAAVALFLEGKRHQEMEDAPTPNPGDKSEQHAVPVYGVGSGAINEIYFPVALVQVLAEFCVVAAVNGDPSHTRRSKVLEDAEQRALLLRAVHNAQATRENPILAIQDMLFQEIAFAASCLLGRVEFTFPELTNALEQMPDTLSGKIPPGLASIMMRALQKVSGLEIDAYNRFRGEIERSLKVRTPKLNQAQVAQLRSAVYREDALKAYDYANALMVAVREVREHTFPHFILSRPFDTAILNCGLNHAVSPVLEQACLRAGVKLVVDFEGMFRSNSATDS